MRRDYFELSYLYISVSDWNQYCEDTENFYKKTV